MARIFLLTVVDGVVGCEPLASLRVKGRFIGIEKGGLRNMLLEQLPESIASDLWSDLRTHATAALDKRNDRRLVARISAPHAALLSSHVGLVCFDGSVKLVRREDVLKGEADAMAHEPRRAIRAGFKLALQLERARLCFAGAHHVEAYQPLVERDMRILADGSNCDRETVKAFCAFVEAGADFLRWVWRYAIDAPLVRVAAMRANRTIRPAQFLEIFSGGFLGRESLRDLHERKIALGVLAARDWFLLPRHDRIMTES